MSKPARTEFCLLCVMTLVLAGCREQVVHNLTEVDANRYVTRLHDADIKAEKGVQPDGMWSLEVDADQAVAAIK